MALIDKPAAALRKDGLSPVPVISAAELQGHREEPIVQERLARIEATAAARAAEAGHGNSDVSA